MQDLQTTKIEIADYHEQMEVIALEAEEDVGELAPVDEEEEGKDEKEEDADGDKTPRQVYLSPAELE